MCACVHTTRAPGARQGSAAFKYSKYSCMRTHRTAIHQVSHQACTTVALCLQQARLPGQAPCQSLHAFPTAKCKCMSTTSMQLSAECIQADWQGPLIAVSTSFLIVCLTIICCRPVHTFGMPSSSSRSMVSFPGCSSLSLVMASPHTTSTCITR